MTGRLIIVVGGQFGSEGKGHLTAQLGMRVAPSSLVIRTGGPNAGHTVWQGETEHKLRMLPTPIAVRDDVHVALAAKSVVDPEVLRAEIATFPGRAVTVDPNATILEPEHQAREAGTAQMQSIGSTRKGIGAARIDRIARVGRTARDLWGIDGSELDSNIVTGGVRDMAYDTLRMGADVIVEAAQGYGLGLHTNYYPYTTSADCTALDALAEAQISPWAVGVVPEIWVAMRPYPIRVAGTSGPLYNETSWIELGLPEERTTVTNKVRRVGHWDASLAYYAMKANGFQGGNVRIGLLMADQVEPAIAGMDEYHEIAKVIADESSLLSIILETISADTGVPIGAIGTGPRTMVFARDAGAEGL